jgi:hypothetical protein
MKKNRIAQSATRLAHGGNALSPPNHRETPHVATTWMALDLHAGALSASTHCYLLFHKTNDAPPSATRPLDQHLRAPAAINTRARERHIAPPASESAEILTPPVLVEV